MATPRITTRRSFRGLALLAALCALLGVAATGCGTEDEDGASDESAQVEDAEDEAAPGDEATDEAPDGADADADGADAQDSDTEQDDEDEDA